MNIILGTATFGTEYGISNKASFLGALDVFQILREAERLGIAMLDTSPAYGQAEEIIGNFHRQANTFDVISKFSDVHDFSRVKLVTQLKESVSKLGISKFSAILFHNSEMLAKHPPHLINATMEDILSTGLVETLGVSVYDEEEIRFVIENFPRITLFQVPENIMDRRLHESILVKKLVNQGIKFHIRSVFLQGLLLMESESFSTDTSGVRFGLSELKKYCMAKEMSVLDACLNYASQIEWASGVVLGVNSKRHLQEILDYQKFELEFDEFPSPFANSILDPRGWAFK